MTFATRLAASDLGRALLVVRRELYVVGATSALINLLMLTPTIYMLQLYDRVLVSNNDDHARNHAAFWDGENLELTPAYDICPQPRAGQTQAQAMEIGPGRRSSQVATCLEHAAFYELSHREAKAIIDHQIETITTEWSEAADVARLTTAERTAMRGHQILNPYASYGYRAV